MIDVLYGREINSGIGKAFKDLLKPDSIQQRLTNEFNTAVRTLAKVARITAVEIGDGEMIVHVQN